MSFIEFEPNNSKYSIRNALSSARCAELSYESAHTIQSKLVTDGFSSHYIEHRDTQLFVASNATDIIVSFRGTTSIKDWMTDAEISFIRGPMDQGQVHFGFMNSLKYVWDDLLGCIENEQTSAQALWITGHSLGGALATLAAARFTFELDKPIRGIYTFGQPRVGDRDFARVYNSELKDRTFRFVNNNDIVTRVPPRELLYSHVGSLQFIDSDLKIHDDISFWQKFIERIKGTLKQHLDAIPSFAEHHFMKNYIAALEKNYT